MARPMLLGTASQCQAHMPRLQAGTARTACLAACNTQTSHPDSTAYQGSCHSHVCARRPLYSRATQEVVEERQEREVVEKAGSMRPHTATPSLCAHRPHMANLEADTERSAAPYSSCTQRQSLCSTATAGSCRVLQYMWPLEGVGQAVAAEAARPTLLGTATPHQAHTSHDVDDTAHTACQAA